MNNTGQFNGTNDGDQNSNSPGGNSGSNQSSSGQNNDDSELLKQQIIKAIPQNMVKNAGTIGSNNAGFQDLLQMLSQQSTQFNNPTMDSQGMSYQGMSGMNPNPSAMMRVIPENYQGNMQNNMGSQDNYNPMQNMQQPVNLMQQNLMSDNRSNSNWTPDELTKLNECLAK